MSEQAPATADSAEPSETIVDCVEVRAVIPAQLLSEISPLLWLMSPNGLQTEDAGTLGAEMLRTGQVRVVLFVAPSEAQATAMRLQAELRQVGVETSVSLRDVVRQDWNKVWKLHYHPLRVGQTVRVEPAWEQGPDEPGIVRIVIDPGMAFGTGTHETTRLAMMALEKWALSEKEKGTDLSKIDLLDAGTGSAILAILAVKLGCRRALGTEVDEVALPSARDNLRLNNVLEQVDLQLVPDPRLLAPGQFAIVTANIISAVLIPLRDSLVERCAPGGTLILSGVLWREVEQVRDHYLTLNLNCLDMAREGEWASLTFVVSN